MWRQSEHTTALKFTQRVLTEVHFPCMPYRVLRLPYTVGVPVVVQCDHPVLLVYRWWCSVHETKQLNAVLEHPAFKADPFETIRQHLQQRLPTLDQEPTQRPSRKKKPKRSATVD